MRETAEVIYIDGHQRGTSKFVDMEDIARNNLCFVNYIPLRTIVNSDPSDTAVTVRCLKETYRLQEIHAYYNQRKFIAQLEPKS